MAKILIVEDNATNLKLATFLLESAGHTVVMDIQLPGMDGLEATAILKRHSETSAIPVIALTALAMKGDEERIRAAGCDGYIAKPMRYHEFLSVVTVHLNGGVADENPS